MKKVNWTRIVTNATIIFLVGYLIYSLLNPNEVESFSVLYSVIFSGITVLVLILTLNTYKELLKVSENTLSFTKTQTSFNFYIDNYKLFYELSKIKTDKVYDNELFDEPSYFFENLTFISIHLNYLRILEKFPKAENVRVKYEIVFKRYNYKIQAFIDLLLDEITKIKLDNNLLADQRVSLINLYKNFILYDYINLSKDLIQNKEINEQGLPPTEIPDYLKCNYNNRKVFDIEQFLKLYYEIENKA